ncbi:MAG: 3-methyl-2-oxobutanoate dehydrogenase subunit VorB [Anaerolineaceae bacterium 4572_78]|nr:MAG: 3-methyl-2-oxobutanoate dehydrogenase subunit VorB [Anaerolineaceae bacterium 4572_78]
MAKEFIKGNEAVVKGAILAGCQSFYGYPITPASEIAEAAAKFFPSVGRVFLQAESEIAAIQMTYGAAAAGERTMTASSSPGVSLKQEGISYAASSELPVVLVDIMRAGPGLGSIAPEQSDYNQIVKGGGHGNYKLIVLAPNSAQEMCNLTMLAFELADKYRAVACVLADGYIGQMMEPVEYPEPVEMKIDKSSWALHATKETRKNLINSIYLEPAELEAHNQNLQNKFAEIEKNEIRFDEYRTDDAEYIGVAYGIMSRIMRSVVDTAREKGIKLGLVRPISLFPFPKAKLRSYRENIKGYFVTELSNGQMVDDVRLAVGELKPVRLYTRMGGYVPSIEEVFEGFEKAFIK